MSNLQREIQLVQKYMRKKIAYANQRGTLPEVMVEQYIELPRAICDVNSAPVKGQKVQQQRFMRHDTKTQT